MKNNEPEFTVTDKRKFTIEGDARPEDRQQEESTDEPSAQQPELATPASGQASEPSNADATSEIPAPPSAQEQSQQHEAYKQSSRDLDTQIRQEVGEHRAREFEVSFERFLTSLYMTALMQLGLVHAKDDQPQVDIVGARQTIDTLGLIQDKTKGNLNVTEANMLQNILYELRMAYVEVTNAFSRPPESGKSGSGPFSR